MKSLWEKLTLLTMSIIDTAISGNGKIRQSVLKEEVGSLISCKTETPVQIKKKKRRIILKMLLLEKEIVLILSWKNLKWYTWELSLHEYDFLAASFQ